MTKTGYDKLKAEMMQANESFLKADKLSVQAAETYRMLCEETLQASNVHGNVMPLLNKCTESRRALEAAFTETRERGLALEALQRQLAIARAGTAGS